MGSGSTSKRIMQVIEATIRARRVAKIRTRMVPTLFKWIKGSGRWHAT
jgi:hypothetical protein